MPEGRPCRVAGRHGPEDRDVLDFPITSDLSAWWAGNTLFVLASVLALTGYGFYTSLARHSL